MTTTKTYIANDRGPRGPARTSTPTPPSPSNGSYKVDGFCDVVPGDDVMNLDPHGDQLMLTITHELMRSPGAHLPIRMLIHEGAKPDDVRRLLEKVLEDLDGCLGYLREETDRELLGRAGIPSEPF